MSYQHPMNSSTNLLEQNPPQPSEEDESWFLGNEDEPIRWVYYKPRFLLRPLDGKTWETRIWKLRRLVMRIWLSLRLRLLSPSINDVLDYYFASHISERNDESCERCREWHLDPPVFATRKWGAASVALTLRDDVELNCPRCRRAVKGAVTLLRDEKMKGKVNVHRCHNYSDERIKEPWRYEIVAGSNDAAQKLSFDIYTAPRRSKQEATNSTLDEEAFYDQQNTNEEVASHISKVIDRSVLKKTLSWVSSCIDTHISCKPESPSVLPTRVLDLSQPKCPKLLESKGLQENYTTLSYCWGKEPFIKTTKESILARKQGISWDALPQTFQDAIEITVQMGIKYIWIDSLCIIQDDHEDWEVESGRMCDVYSNSTLTIAASRASSPHEGCLQARSPTRIVERSHNGNDAYVRATSHHAVKEYDPDDIRFPFDPLLTRGWGYQERRLSPRTLHFTSVEIIFQCQEVHRCECDGTFKPILKSPVQTSQNVDEHIMKWNADLSNFSSMQLTHETDRLPALSGLAQRYNKLGLGRYYAGMWEARIEESLFWAQEHDNCSRPKTYVAPSWSWASLVGEFSEQSYFNIFREAGEPRSKWVSDPYILDIQVTPAGKDPFGELLDARLRIRGFLKFTTYRELSGAGIVPHFDVLEDMHEEYRRKEAIFLGIPGHLQDETSTNMYRAFFLKASLRVKGAYERIGLVTWTTQLNHMPEMEETVMNFFRGVESTIITLV